MGFRVGPFVLCKNGCWRQRHRNTKFGPKKFFPPIIPPPPPHLSSQNDQRDVGIILSHRCWVPPPPPARQVGHPRPEPPRHGGQGGGGVGKMGLRVTPPPRGAIFFPPCSPGCSAAQQAAHLAQIFGPCTLHPEPSGRATNPLIHKWRIPSSKGEHVRTPGSTNGHPLSALMPSLPPPFSLVFAPALKPIKIGGVRWKDFGNGGGGAHYLGEGDLSCCEGKLRAQEPAPKWPAGSTWAVPVQFTFIYDGPNDAKTFTSKVAAAGFTPAGLTRAISAGPAPHPTQCCDRQPSCALCKFGGSAGTVDYMKLIMSSKSTQAHSTGYVTFQKVELHQMGCTFTSNGGAFWAPAQVSFASPVALVCPTHAVASAAVSRHWCV